MKVAFGQFLPLFFSLSADMTNVETKSAFRGMARCTPQERWGDTADILDGRKPGRRWARCALLLAIAIGEARAGQPPPSKLPTLTTARTVHSLTAEEAARAYPVHLPAVVTYYDPYIDVRHGALFVQDSTGAVFVSLPKTPILPLRAGTVVDVAGVSGPGDFASVIEASGIRVIGKSHLPENAPHVSLSHLLTGAEDGQWVEVEGLVRSVVVSEWNAALDLTLTDGTLRATTLREKGVDYDRLIDARVKMRANEAPLFNKDRQTTGARLFFPSMETVTIEEPAPADPFALSIRPISGLLRYMPSQTFLHRVHVRGRVTLQWPGRLLCIQDATEGLCTPTIQTTPVAPGDLVDVVGFPESGEFRPTLTDATFRRAGGGQPIAAIPVTAESAFRGDRDSELVRIEGELIGQDRAATDPALVLSSGRFLFPVILPNGAAGREISEWKEGSRLQVTGVCSVQIDRRSTLMGEGIALPLIDQDHRGGAGGAGALPGGGADLVAAGRNGLGRDGHQVRNSPLRVGRGQLHGNLGEALAPLQEFDFHRGRGGNRSVLVHGEKQAEHRVRSLLYRQVHGWRDAAALELERVVGVEPFRSEEPSCRERGEMSV